MLIWGKITQPGPAQPNPQKIQIILNSIHKKKKNIKLVNNT